MRGFLARLGIGGGRRKKPEPVKPKIRNEIAFDRLDAWFEERGVRNDISDCFANERPLPKLWHEFRNGDPAYAKAEWRMSMHADGYADCCEGGGKLFLFLEVRCGMESGRASSPDGGAVACDLPRRLMLVPMPFACVSSPPTREDAGDWRWHHLAAEVYWCCGRIVWTPDDPKAPREDGETSIRKFLRGVERFKPLANAQTIADLIGEPPTDGVYR